MALKHTRLVQVVLRPCLSCSKTPDALIVKVAYENWGRSSLCCVVVFGADQFNHGHSYIWNETIPRPLGGKALKRLGYLLPSPLGASPKPN